MLSRRCTYGLRALLYLAGQGDASYVSVRQISAALEIPHAMLAKVLQLLTREGMLQACRGPRGGVALARPASELSLQDVIAVIDGPKRLKACVLGLPLCEEAHACPLCEGGPPWQNLQALLTSTSLETLARRLDQQR